jgi:chromosome partitioning protein
MIILLGSYKGGCGKSTLATSLAALLAGKGSDVILVDADKQETASVWAADREASETKPLVPCIQKDGRIKQTLIDLDKRYSHVIVDCAGHDSEELRSAMLAADIMLSPFKASQPDLDTAKKLVKMINDAKDINEKLKTFAVLTMTPSNPAITEIQDAKNYLSSFAPLVVIEPCVYDRKAYRDAVCNGLGVTETNNEKAQGEIEAVWGAING